MRCCIKYRMLLSDGMRVVVESESAGTAIGKALRLYPMRTVVECHSGFTEQEAVLESQLVGTKILPGTISYEIPVHEPLPPQEEGLSGPIGSLRHKTISMFDEADIRLSSKSAAEKFSHA